MLSNTIQKINVLLILAFFRLKALSYVLVQSNFRPDSQTLQVNVKKRADGSTQFHKQQPAHTVCVHRDGLVNPPKLPAKVLSEEQIPGL